MSLDQLHYSKSVCALRLDVPLVRVHVPAFFRQFISYNIALDLLKSIASGSGFFRGHVGLDPRDLGNFVPHGIDSMPKRLVSVVLGDPILYPLKPLNKIKVVNQDMEGS